MTAPQSSGNTNVTPAQAQQAIAALIAAAMASDVVALGVHQLDVGVAGSASAAVALGATSVDLTTIWISITVGVDCNWVVKPYPPGLVSDGTQVHGWETKAKTVYVRADDPPSHVTDVIRKASALLPDMVANKPNDAAHAAIDRVPIVAQPFQLVGNIQNHPPFPAAALGVT